MIRSIGTLTVALICSVLAGCKQSPEAQLRAQIFAIRDNAAKSLDAKVKVNSAWVGGSGDLCGTLDVERFGSTQLGRFAGFPSSAVIETERGSGFGPEWSDRCSEKLLDII